MYTVRSRTTLKSKARWPCCWPFSHAKLPIARTAKSSLNAFRVLHFQASFSHAEHNDETPHDFSEDAPDEEEWPPAGTKYSFDVGYHPYFEYVIFNVYSTSIFSRPKVLTKISWQDRKLSRPRGKTWQTHDAREIKQRGSIVLLLTQRTMPLFVVLQHLNNVNIYWRSSCL